MPSIDLSITAPQDVVQAVTAWRLLQVVGYTEDDPPEPILKYPNNLILLKSIIRDAVLRILDRTPTVSIQAELDEIQVAKQVITQLRDDAVII